MRYPNAIKENDYIGVTAPSMGIDSEKNNLRVNNAIKNIKNKGFNVKETTNVRTSENGKSSSGKQRADELMQLLDDKEVKSIICLEGGDFAVEMLDNLDFDKMKEKLSNTPTSELKWIQGYSDITNLGYVFTLNFDIASIYGPNFKSFGMKNLHISHENSLRLMKKEEFVQNSYEKCEVFKGFENFQEEEDPYEEYDLVQEVKWINLNGEDCIEFSGRAIGGCFDCIKDLIGTKFDKVKDYIKKYKEDGIIWFFDIFETSTPELFRTLWQMKNAGYFDYCKGIIFGRPLMIRMDYDMDYKQAIKEALNKLNIPVIVDADIGHVAPQIPIVNGAILEVKSINGKGTIKNVFK